MMLGLKQVEPLKLHKADKVRYSTGSSYASHGGFSIVPWDNRSAKLLIDWSGRLSVTGRAQDADPLRKGDKFRHGSDLHFLHHAMAVSLDRALCGTQGVGGLLVGLAANDLLEDLPLARRQRCDKSANQIQLDLPATRHLMTRYSPFDSANKLVRRYGLEQKIICARLDGSHRRWKIGMTSKKDDGQGRATLI
jgi:hypothetical protein